jgi:hypothetical protein
MQSLWHLFQFERVTLALPNRYAPLSTLKNEEPLPVQPTLPPTDVNMTMPGRVSHLPYSERFTTEPVTGSHLGNHPEMTYLTS